MTKTTDPLFPGEYSRSEVRQNLNDLIKESSFHDEASDLACDFLMKTNNYNVLESTPEFPEYIDRMTAVFTLCNEYETRYQAIIKKALDETLSQVRAKNDLQEVTWKFPTSSADECIGAIVIDAKTEEHKYFIDSNGKPIQTDLRELQPETSLESLYRKPKEGDILFIRHQEAQKKFIFINGKWSEDKSYGTKSEEEQKP